MPTPSELTAIIFLMDPKPSAFDNPTSHRRNFQAKNLNVRHYVASPAGASTGSSGKRIRLALEGLA